MEFKLIIPGDPIPWARPGQGRHGRYDTQRCIKDAIGFIVKRQWGSNKPLEGFICLKSIFYIPIPQSYSNKKKYELEHTLCNKKPDEDNLSKLYRDIFTEVGIWKDDCQVCSGMFLKLYSSKPRCEFIISETSNEMFSEELHL